MVQECRRLWGTWQYATGDATQEDQRPATPDQLATMQRLIREGLEAGALGLSIPRPWPPCLPIPTRLWGSRMAGHTCSSTAVSALAHACWATGCVSSSSCPSRTLINSMLSQEAS